MGIVHNSHLLFVGSLKRTIALLYGPMNWLMLLNHRRFAIVLVAVWALAYLPNLGLRTLRLEEGRRATPAREMLASGDFIRPTLYGETYLSKPPLYYWIVAATGSILGEVTPLAVRLPSALAALGCAFIALCFAPRTLDRKTRAVAALLVLASAAMLDKGTLGEIDATLCFFVALSLKVWWDGNKLEGQSPESWLFTGLALGVAALLKGPAGPAIFYLTIVPYLIWTRQWRRLFTRNHLACLALTVQPALLWILALLNDDVISLSELLVVWRIQLGGDYAAASISDPGSQWKRIVDHYFSFPLPVLGLLLPAILWLPFALSRKWSIARGIPADLRRFLLCGVLAPCLAFYLYPESRPRHVMATFFSMTMLASLVVSYFGVRGLVTAFGFSGDTQNPKAITNHRTPKILHGLATLLAFAPMALAVAGFLLTISVRPFEIPWAMLVLLVGTLWSWMSVRFTRNTPSEFGAVSVAMTVIAIPLAAWFLFNSIVVPWKAPTNSARSAEELSHKLPPSEVVYTTRTFPTKGDRYFNLQFHLAKNLRATNDLEALKLAAPCLAVITVEERAELESEGWIIMEVGRMGGTPGAPPEVHVVRLQLSVPR